MGEALDGELVACAGPLGEGSADALALNAVPAFVSEALVDVAIAVVVDLITELIGQGLREHTGEALLIVRAGKLARDPARQTAAIQVREVFVDGAVTVVVYAITQLDAPVRGDALRLTAIAALLPKIVVPIPALAITGVDAA